MDNVFGLYQPGQAAFQRPDAALRRFEKEAIRVGTWKLPDGRSFQVTRRRMDHWVRQFKAMTRSGLQISAPVDHSGKSEDNWGWVVGLERRHNTLFATLDVPLEAHAERLGATIREVSIGQKDSYVDGTGREWKDVLTHVSPCTEPVVTGQSNFAPLPVAASQRGEGGAPTAQVVFLRHEQEGEPMDFKVEVSKALGLQEDAAEADILASLKALKESGGDGKVLRQVKTERDNAVAELGKVREKLQAAEAKLSAQDKDDVDDDPKVVALQQRVARLRREAAESEAETLLRAGQITPAMKPHVIDLLVLDDEHAHLRNDAGAAISVADKVGTVLRSLPRGAALDLSERTTFEVENPNDKDKEKDEATLRNDGKTLAAAVQPKRDGK